MVETTLIVTARRNLSHTGSSPVIVSKINLVLSKKTCIFAVFFEIRVLNGGCGVMETYLT